MSMYSNMMATQRSQQAFNESQKVMVRFENFLYSAW